MHHHIDGSAQPDGVTKNEARRSHDTAGPNSQSPSLDCLSEESESKVISTWKARFALLGYALFQLADGSLLVSRWNLTRPVPDLRTLGAVYRQMGGRDA